MPKETFQELLAQLRTVESHIKTARYAMNHADDIREEIQIALEKEADRLGIDPYEVTEF